MLAAHGEATATLESAANLGQKLADELLSKGAAELIAHERGLPSRGGSAVKPVVVTRAESADGPLSAELRTLGLARSSVARRGNRGGEIRDSLKLSSRGSAGSTGSCSPADTP